MNFAHWVYFCTVNLTFPFLLLAGNLHSGPRIFKYQIRLILPCPCMRNLAVVSSMSADVWPVDIFGSFY